MGVVLNLHERELSSQVTARYPLGRDSCLFLHYDFRAKQPMCGACPFAKNLVGHWHSFMACCGTSTCSLGKNQRLAQKS